MGIDAGVEGRGRGERGRRKGEAGRAAGYVGAAFDRQRLRADTQRTQRMSDSGPGDVEIRNDGGVGRHRRGVSRDAGSGTQIERAAAEL